VDGWVIGLFRLARVVMVTMVMWDLSRDSWHFAASGGLSMDEHGVL